MSKAEMLTRERAARVPPIALGILISGRGSNMESMLTAIAEGRLSARCQAVVSDRADAPGLEKARRFGVEAVWLDPAQHPTRAAYQEALAQELCRRQVEVVALAGFMRILRPPLLDAFPGRILNIHPSLLPAFPGLHAQEQAVWHGVRFSGCTVHFVTAGMDEGPIILQAAVPVLAEDDADRLAERILVEEHRIYPLALQLLAEGRLVLDGRRVRIAPPGW